MRSEVDLWSEIKAPWLMRIEIERMFSTTRVKGSLPEISEPRVHPIPWCKSFSIVQSPSDDVDNKNPSKLSAPRLKTLGAKVWAHEVLEWWINARSWQGYPRFKKDPFTFDIRDRLRWNCRNRWNFETCEVTKQWRYPEESRDTMRLEKGNIEIRVW